MMMKNDTQMKVMKEPVAKIKHAMAHYLENYFILLALYVMFYFFR